MTFPVGYVPSENDLLSQRKPKVRRLENLFRLDNISRVPGGRRVPNELLTRIGGGVLSLDTPVLAVRWYPFDNGLFVSTGSEGTVRVWDTTRQETAHMFQLGRPQEIKSLDICGLAGYPVSGTVACGLPNGSAALCDMRTGHCTQRLMGHNAAVLTLRWSPRIAYQLFTGSVDTCVKAWDVRRGKACLFALDQRKLDSSDAPTGESNCGAPASQESGRLSHNAMAVKPAKRRKGSMDTIAARGGFTDAADMWSFVVSDGKERTSSKTGGDYGRRRRGTSMQTKQEMPLAACSVSLDKTRLGTQVKSSGKRPPKRSEKISGHCTGGLVSEAQCQVPLAYQQETLTITGAKATAHDRAVTCLRFTHDGAFLLTQGADKRLMLWNATLGGNCAVNYGTPGGPWGRHATRSMVSTPSEFCIDNDSRVFAGNREHVIVYEMFSGRMVATLSATPVGSITNVVWNSELLELYGGDDKGRLPLWEAFTHMYEDDQDESAIY
eukprot:GHVS01010424.1.p1 GENE.GHVS01010424.1~~GHVS01010424.1.p1  ORF type:complete len:494 (+),score=36.64 GHVS01010424.1:316-1797(+)